MLLKEIFVALGLEVDEAAFAKGQLAAGLLQAGMAKVAEIGKEVIASFIENTKAAIEYGDHVQKTSQSIGIAVEALQELEYAGKLSGLGAQEMAQSVGLLSRKMLEAKHGSVETAKAFRGIKFQENGKLLGADEVMGSIADKFQKMPDGAEKTALAMELFGRAGKQMIPMLNKGSGALEELRKEARGLGLVMSGEATAAAEELNDDLERLHLIGKGLWQQAIAPLIPAMSELVKRFLEWKKANAQVMAQRLQWFIGGLIKAFSFLGDTITFVQTNAFAFKAVAGALIFTLVALGNTAVVAALKTAAAWVVAAAPFIAIAAAVAALFLLLDDVRGYYAGEDSAIGGLFKLFDDWLVPRDTDAWWLVQIKEFLRVLNNASRSVLEFGEKAVAAFHDIGDVIKYLPPVLIARGLKSAGESIGAAFTDDDNYDNAHAGARYTGKQSNSIGGGFGPYAKAPAIPFGDNFGYGEAGPGGGVTVAAPSVPVGGASSMSVSAPVNIQVIQREGEDGPALGQRIADTFKTLLQGTISDTVAGVRGGT